jgi:5-methylthioribose kinase
VRGQIHLSEANLADYLRGIGLVDPGDPVAVEKAGDGNINWVRRVSLPGGKSFVVKQARPALERFPQYQVDTARIVFEARYYETVRPFDPEGVCPAVHGFDEEARVLILEDLGPALRLDRALARGSCTLEVAATLGRFLGRVHAATGAPELAARFANDAMRGLHGDHIFLLPFRDNDFPLEAAVAERAARVRGDAELVAAAEAAYARYLEPRGALVHGDVQAGNVLLPEAGPRLLDAEIAHVGDPAFDVGSLVAHLAFPAAARGHVAAARPLVEAAWSAYLAAHRGRSREAGSQHAGAEPPRFAAVARYAGLEWMRRTIGAARVDLVAGARASLAVIDVAERMIRRPPESVGEFPG